METTRSWSIYIVSPPGYIHSRAFQEVAEGLQQGFAELGFVVPIVYDVNRITGRGIILGANLLPTDLPPNCILYNLEQWRSGWMNQDYLNLLRQHEVWDYSTQNIQELRNQGIEAKQLQIGYERCLTRIQPQTEDIDVLFYGAIFGRRIPILEAVEATGLKVKRLFGVYGEERDAWIARSKIVLNIHAYEDAPFEMARVSYLWANHRFVVTEKTMDLPYSDIGMVFADDATYLPQACLRYAADSTSRCAIAQRGFETFKRTRQSEYLRPLLRDPWDLSHPSHQWLP